MKKIVVSLALVSLVGCAALSSSLLKKSRSPQNDGMIVSSDIDTLSAAAEKVFQDKGFKVSSQEISDGPGGRGIEITGIRVKKDDLKNIGAGVAANVATNLLGGGQNNRVKVADGELYNFWFSKKWDEASWDGWDAGKYVVRIGGSKFDKDQAGHYYNRQGINQIDLRAMEDEVVNAAKAQAK